MSLGIAIWHTLNPLGDTAAGEIYAALARGEQFVLPPHPAMEDFHLDLVARYPELHDVPPEDLGRTDVCPWACTMQRSPCHLLLSCVLSVQEPVGDFIGELQRKHRVSVYLPAEGKEYFPDD